FMLFFIFFFYCFGDLLYLHSFPTRRSSDLLYHSYVSLLSRMFLIELRYFWRSGVRIQLHNRNHVGDFWCLLVPLALLLFRNQGRALVVVVISHLTIQTVVTFIDVDGRIGMDRLNLTLLRTQLAGATTLLTRLEPVEQPELGGNGQRCTQWADIAAVYLACEDID